MPRIRWTTEEQQLLINEAAMVLLDKKAFSLREAFSVAQAKLPKHRCREIAALSQVPWFTDEVPKKVKLLEAERYSSFESKLAQGIAEARLQERDRLQEEIASQLGKFLARALVYALEDPELRYKLFSPTPATTAPPAVKTHKERRIRVVVAGAMNNQARTLEEAYGAKLDLRFWSKDQSHETLKQMLAHADHAVGMISFLPHSADGILKASKVNYHPVSGGVTNLKSALEKLV